MNNTTRFDGKGDIYAKDRPGYAAELFDYIRHTLSLKPGSAFADVGSGTGIFSASLLACGYRVYAVEPNADMRRKAEEKLSACESFFFGGRHGRKHHASVSERGLRDRGPGLSLV